MLIKYAPQYADILRKMITAFYNSEACLHSIPDEHITNTLQELESGSPFAEAYMISSNDKIAGYVLLAHTYSNEAGGRVVWIEELYIAPEYRGLGLGRASLEELFERYDTASRFRLEVSPANDSVKKLYEKCAFCDLEYTQMYRGK